VVGQAGSAEEVFMYQIPGLLRVVDVGVPAAKTLLTGFVEVD